jgi:predicted RND superfamily exporter protein
MKYTLKRTFKTITAPTIAIAACFLSNLYSPFLPIRSIALFHSIMLVVNYVLLFVMIPPMIIFVDEKLRPALSYIWNVIFKKWINRSKKQVLDESAEN